MSTDISVDCNADMDLYDEAILGLGPTSDPVDMDDSPALVYESKDCENPEGMNLYDDVKLLSAHQEDREYSPPRYEHYGRSHDGGHRSSSKSHSSKYHDHDSHKYFDSKGHEGNKSGVDSFCLYIGNLTWWTTEADVTEAIHSLGVLDFVDVKFFENVSNGQSKGFCKLTLGSNQSTAIVKERLPEMKLHGRNPIVEYPTRNILFQFEAQNPLRSRSRRSFYR